MLDNHRHILSAITYTSSDRVNKVSRALRLNLRDQLWGYCDDEINILT